MQLATRKLLDRSFTAVAVFSILIMTGFLLVLLVPIFWKGSAAFFFRETVEHREFLYEQFERGDRDSLQDELARAEEAREPVYRLLAEVEAAIGSFEEKASGWSSEAMAYRREHDLDSGKVKSYVSEWNENLDIIRDNARNLLGPLPDDAMPGILFKRYGETRWDRVDEWQKKIKYDVAYEFTSSTEMGTPVDVPRVEAFEMPGGKVMPEAEQLIETLTNDQKMDEMLRPRYKIYWRFLFDESPDSFHYLGGIWAPLLGTLYLTIGAMIVAGPVGVISAIYLSEYAPDNWFISIVRSCISTLAGVPSIVFGLFGLAFFVGRVTDEASVIAGSLTLAVLVLPTVIRASEEAVKAVPHTYKEAALALGASRWRTTFTVVLPASLPGVLTSIIISMGRAAGETAPIIFTAAVSLRTAGALPITEINKGTEALPWAVYNMCSENIYAPHLPHVQFGMVSTLIAMVLMLNLTAILLRARVTKKLRG